MKEFVPYFFAVISVLVAWFLPLQEKPKEDPKPKTVSLEIQNRILRAQKSESQIQVNFQSCQRNWQGDFQIQEAQIKLATTQAFKESGFDPKDYELNMETFEFAKKVPTSVLEPPKPQEKKP